MTPWPIVCVIGLLFAAFFIQEFYLLPKDLMRNDSAWRLRISDLLGATTAVILAFVITYSFSLRLQSSSATIGTAVTYLARASSVSYELLNLARKARDNPEGFQSWHFANKLNDIELFVRLAQSTVESGGWHSQLSIQSTMALPLRTFSEALGEHALLHEDPVKRVHHSVQVEDAHAKLQDALNIAQHEISQL